MGKLLLMVCLCVSLQRTAASLVSLEAFPKDIVENITQAVAMRCSVSDNAQATSASTVDDIRHISSIFISRGDGDDIASLTAFDPATALADLGNLEVKGSVSGTSGEGFLELSWKDPSKVTVGDYVCTVTAVDTKGHSVVMTSGVLVTSVTPTVMELIQNVNLKVAQQQAVIAQQHQDIQQQNQDITKLQQDNIQLQQKLTSCSQQIAFDARLSRGTTVTGGQNVVYEVTMVNFGNGYNNSTGVFTCVVPGLYVFTVHGFSNGVSSDYMYLGLNHNSEYVATLWAGSDDTHESASMSAVVHMQAGDVVKVVAGHTSKLYSTSSHLENTFHGHLVQADGCQP